jgi:putative DNA methylase
MFAMNDLRLIETDHFPFEFISRLAEHESWRKEIHRPIYHIHKWWAKRLGSVFRGILLGATLPETADLVGEFYNIHCISDLTVFDPFMGSGTPIGEAHKLGLTAFGRDINPVAVNSVRAALGTISRASLQDAFNELSVSVGENIRNLYHSKDSSGHSCEALYYFWVMQVPCLVCRKPVDLFPSWVIARNAYPNRKPAVQILCPSCGHIFSGRHSDTCGSCPSCNCHFNPEEGTAKGAKALCRSCEHTFTILDSVATLYSRPDFRLYGKLVLTQNGAKEYLPVTSDDQRAYRKCTQALQDGAPDLPRLKLKGGYNTRQAISYNFLSWRDFFNDRQLLALSMLRQAICTQVDDPPTRTALLTLFSGVLEFNNLFASYKGEGTGAVRHMFSHHILKPERVPIEANVWGTPKSSGSFSNLFRSRLLKVIDYRLAPTEVNGSTGGTAKVSALPFSGLVQEWPTNGTFSERGIYLSCGDSASTGLPDGSIDLVVTDPPFFDNVHYSELADFFYSWQQLSDGRHDSTTRSPNEVQDADPSRFAKKLTDVFRECKRLLKEDGLLVFSYHHSRDEGWSAVAEAILNAGFIVINSQPVKAEMSVATPKAQAKDPIQLDILIVCRLRSAFTGPIPTSADAHTAARRKVERLHAEGFTLSRNDQKIIFFGQLLTTLLTPLEADCFADADRRFEVIESTHQTPARPQMALDLIE